MICWNKEKFGPVLIAKSELVEERMDKLQITIEEFICSAPNGARVAGASRLASLTCYAHPGGGYPL